MLVVFIFRAWVLVFLIAWKELYFRVILQRRVRVLLFRVLWMLFLLLQLVSQFPHFVILLALLVKLEVIEDWGLRLKVQVNFDHVGCLCVGDLLSISGICDRLVFILSKSKRYLRDYDLAEVLVRDVFHKHPLQLKESFKLFLLSPVVEVVSEVNRTFHLCHTHELLACVYREKQVYLSSQLARLVERFIQLLVPCLRRGPHLVLQALSSLGSYFVHIFLIKTLDHEESALFVWFRELRRVNARKMRQRRLYF